MIVLASLAPTWFILAFLNFARLRLEVIISTTLVLPIFPLPLQTSIVPAFLNHLILTTLRGDYLISPGLRSSRLIYLYFTWIPLASLRGDYLTLNSLAPASLPNPN